MSEAIPGISQRPIVAVPRDAAIVVPIRHSPRTEVFLVKRTGGLSFSGGFHAFPGGSVEPSDASLGVALAPKSDAPIYAAAIRETLEEAGLLLVDGGDLSDIDAMRRELLAGGDFRTLLAERRIELSASRLIPAGRWVTPPFSPIRFDARLFLAEVDAESEASIILGELVAGQWIEPAAALAQWARGTMLLHPPTRHVLATLAGYPFEAAIPRLRRPLDADEDGVATRIEFQRGILMVPLRTETLPPATHTNCYVVGTRELAVVDPGSLEPSEQRRMGDLLTSLREEGRIFKVILLTHHHRDHVDGAVQLGRRFGVSVLASGETADRVPGVEGLLQDGSLVRLAGPMPMEFSAILCEGHARGHLAFRDRASGALLAGDMVAGGSTIVIDPPDGHMGTYLESLRLLQRLEIGAIYPAHGIPMPDGEAVLLGYLRHREMRCDRIRQVLQKGDGEGRTPHERSEGPQERVEGHSLKEVVIEAYSDVSAYLHPAAERSALATLLYLRERGEAEQAKDGSWLRRA